MLAHTIWIVFLALIVSACASEGKMGTSGGSSSLAGSTTVRSDTISGGVAVASPTMSAAEASTNFAPNAAEIAEETLDTCLGRIPKDASVGQRMLAEQTCRRDFAIRH
jgi:hypothetical protein